MNNINDEYIIIHKDDFHKLVDILSKYEEDDVIDNLKTLNDCTKKLIEQIKKEDKRFKRSPLNPLKDTIQATNKRSHLNEQKKSTKKSGDDFSKWTDNIKKADITDI